MGDKTGISWTDSTWNPIVGCSIVSPGCTNCYAMKMAARIEAMNFGRHAKHAPTTAAIPQTPYEGTTQESKAGPVWTGKVAQASDDTLTLPLRWKRPRRIFVNSMGDLFHESVPGEWIDRVFAVMALSPRHTFQVLTKRPARMRQYFAPGMRDARDRISSAAYPMSARWQVAGMPTVWPLPNVWLGVSTEDQRRADERVPDLLATPAAVRFVSAEPLLGPIDFRLRFGPAIIDALSGVHSNERGEIIIGGKPRLDWTIVGGESGPGARPMHPDWARSIRDQCAVAGVPFFMKQWGEWTPCDLDATDSSRGGWLSPDGTLLNDVLEVSASKCAKPCRLIFRTGVRRAGHLLDRVEHHAFPGKG